MISLSYGESRFPLSIPRDKIAAVVEATPPVPADTPERLVAAALDVCEPFLAEFRRGERVVVITSDITRYTGSEIYLPLLVERLNARGIADGDITILIALGIHRKQSEAEHRKILGSLYGRIRVLDHECDDPGKLVMAGRTSGGIEVEVNRLAAEADRLILTGVIGFHYFAGFGGGRKSVLPGIAGRRSCMASHFAVLNPGEGTGKNPAAATGVLQGNPVHAAIEEACAMLAPSFILNTVLAPDKQIIACFAGHWRDAHAEGCRFYADAFSYPLGRKADLVVVSCGGFPKDINLIQAHKSMEYASRALKEGGVMVLLAECRDGFGNGTFFDWFRHRELDEFEAALRRRYEINGQTAYSLLDKAKRFRIILVSSFPAHEVETMSLIPASSLDEALAKARELLPENPVTYVIPEGGTVLPVTGSAHGP